MTTVGGIEVGPPPPAYLPDRGRLRVAVVGGGAAGVLTALHLFEHAKGEELELTLLDRGDRFGPGVAYGTSDPLHLLNVPAVRMGALAGRGEHFHEWLTSRGEEVGPGDFVRRGLYGDYLGELLERLGAAVGARRLRRVGGEAVALERRRHGRELSLRLADGCRIDADKVVLALGPPPPADPVDVPADLLGHGYVRDPWRAGALDAARGSDSVLVVGTGLTMVDIALSLASGRGGPRVLALSRHGLVPRRHRTGLTQIEPFELPIASGELQPVIAATLARIGEVEERGGDWRDVVDSMRPRIPAVWRSLRLGEKRRFLGDLQRYWDVHRFRMAPAVADRFAALRASGQVTVLRGSLGALDSAAGRPLATVLHGDGDAERIEFDQVINCSGPGPALGADAPPILADLVRSGIGRADPLALGLDVGAGGALIGGSGEVSDQVFAIGALCRGRTWEAISVTEIRDHAAALAAHVLAGARRIEAASAG